MSKDSSATYLHFHQPRLADFFEDFNRPHTSALTVVNANNPASIANAPGANGISNATVPPAQTPSFLPIEEIFVLPQHQPVNPEDEDDVVPDQHAAFGIARAMDGRREIVWRDLGLEELMNGINLGSGATNAEGDLVGSQSRRLKKVVCLR